MCKKPNRPKILYFTTGFIAAALLTSSVTALASRSRNKLRLILTTLKFMLTGTCCMRKTKKEMKSNLWYITEPPTCL